MLSGDSAGTIFKPFSKRLPMGATVIFEQIFEILTSTGKLVASHGGFDKSFF